MSAIATVLARMGHTVSGSDLRESSVARAAAAARRHDARRSRGREPARHARRGRDLDRDPREQPRGRRRARARHPGAAPRRRARAPSSRPARTIAVAGTHGKTTTSSMLALILRAAGLAPELPHRRRAQRGRHQRGVRRRRVAGGRGRRERRHVPRARARRRDRHQRRARPPRPLRRLRRARRGVRVVRRPHPGRVALCADDAVAAAIARRVRPATSSPTGSPTRRLPHRRLRGRARRHAVHAVAPGECRSGPSSCRSPGATTRSTRPARPRSRSSSACRSTR